MATLRSTLWWCLVADGFAAVSLLIVLFRLINSRGNNGADQHAISSDEFSNFLKIFFFDLCLWFMFFLNVRVLRGEFGQQSKLKVN